MENLKSRVFSMPLALQQIPQPNAVQQNAYYDLMPVTPNACTSSVYPSYETEAGGVGNGGEGGWSSSIQIHQTDDFDVNGERLAISREHKLLGKRKSSHRDLDEESSKNGKSSLRMNYGKKQNHSEIEKRRRDKMNAYITQLATMVPVGHTNARKLDKLTVLRMAVQHLRSIRGTVHSYPKGHYKPTFLSDEELKHLILQAADGFLFVVGCDRGRILFVSQSVSQILNYSQSDLLGQSWFDMLHPRDVAKVKEQLLSPDLGPKERCVDSKSMTRLCPGSRRSFLCRMKRRVQVKRETDATAECSKSLKKEQSPDKTYTVIQCIGYLKSWTPAATSLEETEGENDGEVCDLSCLVAVGRIQSQITGRHCLPFVSRHAIDGTFLFVDQRATIMLGFLPQELVGTNIYEYFHQEDVRTLSETHKLALQSQQVTKTQSYRLRTKDGSYVRIQSEWKPFKNPWTKDIEYFISKNSVILSDSKTSESNVDCEDEFEQPSHNDTFSTKNAMNNVQKVVNSNIEVSRAGQQMALEGIPRKKEAAPNVCIPTPLKSTDTESSIYLTSVESKMLTSAMNKGNRSSSILQTTNAGEVIGYGPCTHKNAITSVSLNDSAVDSSVSSGADILDIMNGTMMHQVGQQSNVNEGNDEAAMAAIMSLLEADSGLNGPMDFQGLNWPLS